MRRKPFYSPVRMGRKFIETKSTLKMARIMKKNKLTQLRLAEILGITNSAISNWFKVTGSVPPIHFQTLKKAQLR